MQTVLQSTTTIARTHLSKSSINKRVRIGVGREQTHFGEFIQGKFDVNETDRALVTVICNRFWSKAKFHPKLNGGIVTVNPTDKTKSLRAAELTLLELSEYTNGYGGNLVIESKIPEKWGMGSSTSNCIAAIRAVADSFYLTLRPETIAKIVVTAETASDSIMFGSNAVLFRHRQGTILENFGGKIPYLRILGFNTDPKGVDTLEMQPAQYCLDEIEVFKQLRCLMRKAVVEQSAELIGKVATVSAIINQNYLPKPSFQDLQDIAKKAGAVGVNIAHSGTVVGILFDARTNYLINKFSECKGLLSEIGIEKTWEFEVGHPQWEVKY